MGARRVIGIDAFIERLQSVEAGLITRDVVADICDGVHISESSLAPYTYFDDTFYTRNLIYRDALIEVMAICWQPGQRTAVHTHNGQLCWMLMERGQIQVVDYKWLGCDHPEKQNVVGIDCLAGSDHIQLDRLREIDVYAGGPVVTADKLQTIHQLFNGNERSVSIHVYSRPIDSCVAFDMQNNRCYRRQLSYFSKYGERTSAAPAERKGLPVISAQG
jgi:cysteine dioxygenase